MVDYPAEEDIEELNREILRTIRVRKADMHRVIRRAAIAQAIKAAMDDSGDIYDKAVPFLSNLCKAIRLTAGTEGPRSRHLWHS